MPDLPSLADIAPTDRPRVGGKALQLALLARRGLPVPAGFVVPTEVFRGAMADAGLTKQAEEVARQPSEAAARALHDAILGIALPAGLEAALRDGARRLGPRTAVRSSAIDEDGRRRSFAGQHLTILHTPPEEVGQALRRCWASLYEPAAIAYRARTGQGPAPGGMAVLVQRMIEPVVSGVLFTINPLNGSWREMVVESTWGLGEGLMAGLVTPHWHLVRRPRRAPKPVQRLLSRVRLQLVQQDEPDIAEQWVAYAGGVRREPVPEARRGRPTLDRDQLFRLCRLGLRVEGELGEPQDVEWAIDSTGELLLLQARPITTAGPPRAREDVLWTRRFVGERWPEPATPLGWSLLAPVFEWFIAYPDTQVRHLGGGPAVKLEHSRPYVNATVFRHLAFKLPGAPPPRFMLELVPPEEEAEWQRRFAALPDFGVYGSIFRETFREKRWRRFRWNPFTNHRAWEAFRERLEAELPRLSRAPTSERDAVRLVGAQLELVRGYIGVHITSLLFANLFWQLLESALATWVPEEATRLMDGLATCPTGNLTLQTNEALWGLARRATDDDLARLERGEATGAFGEALAAFLREYGHRANASWEIFSPRWGDSPELLVPLLRAHRRAGAVDPALRAREQQAAYDVASRRLAELVLGGPRRAVLDRLVDLTRRYLLLRENQRFWFDRLLYAMQRTLVAAGERFVARGWLVRADDVAFLTWDEVQGLAEETHPPDGVREWVDRRRAQREADSAELPPVFLRGGDAAAADVAAGARLQGLGISPGRATGRVRVLRSPAEGHRLQPGDVLVTHAVDPGWTPLFLHAGAIVLEMGSRLSHGAVVAREYRIPAVVNIEGVTRRLVDGEQVTVDGTRGIVWLHP